MDHSMLGVYYARFEIVNPILRIVVLLGVFELLYDTTVVVTGVKLFACSKLLLTARMVILVGDVR